ncbi:MAG: hypothetical protein AAFV53_33495 [Myxococcota bacterium]
MDVVICAWAEVEEWMEQREFDFVISIGASQSAPPPPLDAPPASLRVCRLEFYDTLDGGPDGPHEYHVLALIDFCEEIIEADGAALAHCEMGVSRSAAAALILLAVAMGPGRERASVGMLETLEGGDRARPNARIIALADEILGRDGDLLSAMLQVYGA